MASAVKSHDQIAVAPPSASYIGVESSVESEFEECTKCEVWRGFGASRRGRFSQSQKTGLGFRYEQKSDVPLGWRQVSAGV